MSEPRTPAVFVGFVSEEGRLTLDYPRAFIAYAKRFKGNEVEVEIRKRRTKRSDRQNAAFWAAITPWAHFLGYEPTFLKDELLGLLWGYDERASALTNEVLMLPKKPRSSQLTTAEMGELMEFAAVKAAETGYVLELPDEFKARKARKGRAA